MNGNTLVWALNNGGSTTVTLSEIQINWPDVPPSQSLQQITFGGVAIWQGQSPVPPSIITGDWLGSLGDRQLAPGATKALEFVFSQSLAALGHDVTAIFDNGCQASASL